MRGEIFGSSSTNVTDEQYVLAFVRKSDPKPFGRPRGRWENGI